MTSLICGIQKETIQMNLLTKRKQTHRIQKELILAGGRMGVRDSQGVGNGHVYTAIFTVDNQQGPSVQHMVLCLMLRGRLGFGREGIHEYVWLSPFDIHLKLSQHCLLISYKVKGKVKVLATQLHLTLCDPVDCSLPGPLSAGFPRQGSWSGLPFPSPGDLPDPGIEPGVPHCRRILYCLYCGFFMGYQGSH